MKERVHSYKSVSEDVLILLFAKLGISEREVPKLQKLHSKEDRIRNFRTLQRMGHDQCGAFYATKRFPAHHATFLYI